MYKCNVNRMEDKIKTFSQLGEAGHGGITRYSLSKEAEMARDEFVMRMKATQPKLKQMIWQISMQPFQAPIQMQKES